MKRSERRVEWTKTLPARERVDRRIEIADLPTRKDRISRLGVAQTTSEDRVRTGYIRLALDTLLNAGWLKQVQVDDIEAEEPAEDRSRTDASVQIGFPSYEPGVSVIRASWNVIAVGMQNGLIHIFDWEGSLKRTFQVGDTSVSDLLVTAGGLQAAFSAGRLTLFDAGRISASTEMPDHSAELSDCGNAVLAWQSKSVWLVETSGRVQLVVETDRPIQGVWGHGSGFYVLAGDLASFQLRA